MKKLLVMLGLIGLMTVNSQAIIIGLGIDIGEPSDVVSEMNRLNDAIINWNAGGPPPMDPEHPEWDAWWPLDTISSPEWNGSQTDTTGQGDSIVLDLTGLDGYLLLKWGGTDQFFYVNGETEWSFVNTTVYNTQSPISPALGLSHYTTFTQNVPDGGSTLAFMGFGVLLLGAAKRKFNV